MKLRHTILFVFAAIMVSACNLTLAEDVTPPPGYVPPTPMPTLALVPPQRPNVANGQAIYFEKCAACHGETGLGDGAQGIQLGVTVPAFAIAESARSASPSQWYTTVTRGRMDRFMPPFASLNDQERWDVVAYIMTLHTSTEEIQKGKEIFDANCTDCSTDYYKDLSKMSDLSTVALARIVRLGNETIPAFGENLPDAETWAVAEYLRSLSYDVAAPATPTVVPATETPAPVDTPSAEGTPIEGTPQTNVQPEATVVVKEGFGTVSGTIDNKTGKELPSDLKITLRGYEHDLANPNAGTQEVLTLEGVAAPDGSFIFENVEMPENRIFLAEAKYEGMDVTSDYVVVEAGQSAVTILPLVIYPVTDDTSSLTVDELDIFLSEENETTYNIYAVYNFRNTGDAIVSISMGTSQEIPFLKFPVEAQGMGYDAMQGSAPFIDTADGIAMKPSDQPYNILAVASIAKTEEFTLSQPFVLPVSVVRIFVPEGMEVEGTSITKDQLQDIQGMSYQSYLANGVNANDTLSFKVSGTPKTASTPEPAKSTTNNALLIGAGGLGLALILAGGWMYLRDRKKLAEEIDEEDDEEEFETAEDVMDAIIALDDLHRAKRSLTKHIKSDVPS
ncbi:MAG: c-type cytochrome [Anaerolineales bacterium]|nr:c-type cytochrome [Anaerolineales bacterium]